MVLKYYGYNKGKCLTFLLHSINPLFSQFYGNSFCNFLKLFLKFLLCSRKNTVKKFILLLLSDIIIIYNFIYPHA